MSDSGHQDRQRRTGVRSVRFSLKVLLLLAAVAATHMHDSNGESRAAKEAGPAQDSADSSACLNTLHGDEHPPVVISRAHLVYLGRRAEGISMELRADLDGLVAGFTYSFMVQDGPSDALYHRNVTAVGTESVISARVRVLLLGAEMFESRHLALHVFDTFPQLSKIGGKDVRLPLSLDNARAEDIAEYAVESLANRPDAEHDAASQYNSLFWEDFPNLFKMQAYHRGQLCRHFARMRHLKTELFRIGKGKMSLASIPVLWWHRRAEARQFYDALLAKEATDSFPELERKRFKNIKPVNWQWVLEDLHVGGRGLAGDEAHEANELTISERYKLIYVTVRKCANTAIRRFMKQLDADRYWCDTRLCKTFRGRCTSLCANPDLHLNGSYLIFSFVQHPVRRFFKAMTTLAPQNLLLSPDPDRAPDLALRLLHALQERGHPADHHMETQTFALTSETVDPLKPQMHLDFIGRLESIEQDWQTLVQLANSREDVPAIKVASLAEVRHEEKMGESDKTALWRRLMTPQVISLAHETYAQDIVSLGYGWLDGSSYLANERELEPPFQREFV